MNRPTWVTVVAVLGIIFGCFGILGGAQEITLPQMIKMQKEIFTTIEQTSSQNKSESSEGKLQDNIANKKNFPNPDMFKAMEKMWDFPEWFVPWSIFSGCAKALISAVYLYASICLLQMKPFSIRLFYYAAGSSIVLCILKGVVATFALSFIGMAMLVSSAFGAVIDLVLIIVVATSEKEAFKQRSENPPGISE